MEKPIDAENKWRKYRVGELDLILSLVPTKQNIARLASSLGRSSQAIEVVYKLAYTKFGKRGAGADVQRKKVGDAKRKAGIIFDSIYLF